MGRFYKLFKARRTVFYVTGFILATLFSGGAQAAKDDRIYTVQGVEVDVTAEDAMMAREQAFEKAQQSAFEQLAARLLPENQKANFQMPDVSTISAMVNDFEITKEKISNVRYIATYTFRFKNDEVRNYLGGNGYAYSDVSSKPVLVLPYYQWGSRTLLWDNNPWLEAWSKAQAYQGLVPVIVPIGDVQDVSEMGDNDALTYDAEKLASMMQRYGAGEAIIMLATPEWDNGVPAEPGLEPDRLTVMVYRTDRGKPEYANKIELSKKESWQAANIYAAAVDQGRNALQQAWKNQTVASPDEKGSIQVRVRFSGMQEWIDTQSKLRRVPGVNDIKILSLTQNEAHVELQFRGSEETLRLALSQSDISLSSPYNAPTRTPYGRPDAVYDVRSNQYYRPY